MIFIVVGNSGRWQNCFRMDLIHSCFARRKAGRGVWFCVVTAGTAVDVEVDVEVEGPSGCMSSSVTMMGVWICIGIWIWDGYRRWRIQYGVFRCDFWLAQVGFWLLSWSSIGNDPSKNNKKIGKCL